ncbi:MAG: ankyrin repeat domain-containing protein [Gammaproteobacteria bacterium]
MSAFHDAIDINDSDLIKALVLSIQNGNNEINSYSDQGFPPLHYAAIQGKLELLPVLIEVGANITELDLDGNTFLRYITDINQRKTIISELIDSDLVNKEFLYEFLLEDRKLNHWLELHQFKGVNTVNSEEFAPLRLAFLQTEYPIMMLLLNRGATFVDDKNVIFYESEKNDPLPADNLNDFYDCIERCEWHEKVKQFVFVEAIKRGHVELVEFHLNIALLQSTEHLYNLFVYQDDEKKTPLDYAAINWNPEVCQLLRDALNCLSRNDQQVILEACDVNNRKQLTDYFDVLRASEKSFGKRRLETSPSNSEASRKKNAIGFFGEISREVENNKEKSSQDQQENLSDLTNVALSLLPSSMGKGK